MKLDELPDLIPQWAAVIFEDQVPTTPALEALPRVTRELQDLGNPVYWEADTLIEWCHRRSKRNKRDTCLAK